MSYCKKCGAYIPDGQEICLACGFDEAGEKRKENSGSSAYAYAPQSEQERRNEENARRRAEQRRREQQEMNRKWAESEQRRRQQQEVFRRSQEEAARRSAEYDAQRATNEDGYYRIHRTDASSSANRGTSAADNKIYSYMSYISFLCFLPSILGVKDAKTEFHAKQGKKLFFAGLAGKIVGSIFGFGWAVELAQIALTFIGLRNVSNDVTQELPIVGRLGEK